MLPPRQSHMQLFLNRYNLADCNLFADVAQPVIILKSRLVGLGNIHFFRNVNLNKETVVAKRQYVQIQSKLLFAKIFTFNTQQLISLK